MNINESDSGVSVRRKLRGSKVMKGFLADNILKKKYEKISISSGSLGKSVIHGNQEIVKSMDSAPTANSITLDKKELNKSTNQLKRKPDVNSFLKLFEIDNSLSQKILHGISSSQRSRMTFDGILKYLSANSYTKTTKLQQDVTKFLDAAVDARIIRKKGLKYCLTGQSKVLRDKTKQDQSKDGKLLPEATMNSNTEPRQHVRQVQTNNGKLLSEVNRSSIREQRNHIIQDKTRDGKLLPVTTMSTNKQPRKHMTQDQTNDGKVSSEINRNFNREQRNNIVEDKTKDGRLFPETNMRHHKEQGHLSSKRVEKKRVKSFSQDQIEENNILPPKNVKNKAQIKENQEVRNLSGIHPPAKKVRICSKPEIKTITPPLRTINRSPKILTRSTSQQMEVRNKESSSVRRSQVKKNNPSVNGEYIILRSGKVLVRR